MLANIKFVIDYDRTYSLPSLVTAKNPRTCRRKKEYFNERVYERNIITFLLTKALLLITVIVQVGGHFPTALSRFPRFIPILSYHLTTHIDHSYQSFDSFISHLYESVDDS